MADVLVLVERLRGRTVRGDLFEATVRSVRSVSGFDRVMLYRFDEEGHGSVVAEVARPGMVSYRGHRFPASDIPEPARRLYRKNRIRYIPDARFFFLRLDGEMLWIGSGEFGTAPDGLVEHLSSRLEEDKIEEVRSIVGEVDEGWTHSEEICGYLALRLGSSPRRFCVWFRPEERETIEWGGNPRHPVQSSDGGGLAPRDSFETWTEIVTDRCPAWTELDRVTARELTQLLDELIIEVQADRLRRATRKLEKLARTDDLTGLANRREVQRRLQAEGERARRYGSPLSAVILDLDHFKAVNDRYGHQAGDRVLRRVWIARRARTSRCVARTTPCTGRRRRAGTAPLLIDPPC